MADAFDQLLASSLGPDDRLPDRCFVARIQARIILEEQLALERRTIIGGFVAQLAGLLAVAAAVWVVGSAAPVERTFVQWPAAGLLLLLVAFAFIVAIFSRSGRSGDLAAID